MTFRWYGEGIDSIPLEHIKQIPGVTGVVWSLHDTPAGDEWDMDKILAVRDHAAKYNLNIDVVESVNVHEDIKLGLNTRDKYIENYKNTLKKLGAIGVKVVCYNFMPVFDWTRTDLFKKNADGSTALFFEKSKIDGIQPLELVKRIEAESDGLTMPGWEPERLAKLTELFKAYEAVDTEKLWANLEYFLKEVIPTAEEAGIKMAIHPDDPPYPIFGLPRIITCRESLKRLTEMVKSPSNGLTLCTGSLGAVSTNDMVALIKEFGEFIHFAHIRNVKLFDNGDFIETSHRFCDGSLDIVEIVKTYHHMGYKGYIRPDHGRHIWDEKCRPGYGLYDRALGVMYILGIWDMLDRSQRL